MVHNTPGVALLASLPLVLGRIEADIGRCRLLVGAAHAPVRHEYVQTTDRVVRTAQVPQTRVWGRCGKLADRPQR